MVHTIAQITGTGATVAISATNQRAKWVRFSVPQTSPNSAEIRLGDSSTAIDRGDVLPKTCLDGVLWPPMGDIDGYDLGGIYAYIGNNDKLDVIYGL